MHPRPAASPSSMELLWCRQGAYGIGQKAQDGMVFWLQPSPCVWCRSLLHVDGDALHSNGSWAMHVLQGCPPLLSSGGTCIACIGGSQAEACCYPDIYTLYYLVRLVEWIIIATCTVLHGDTATIEKLSIKLESHISEIDLQWNTLEADVFLFLPYNIYYIQCTDWSSHSGLGWSWL